MKKKVEYEVRFKTKDQKIILREYAKETIVSWSNGREKKVFKGDEAMWRAAEYIDIRWKGRKITYCSLKPLTEKEIQAQKEKNKVPAYRTDLQL